MTQPTLAPCEPEKVSLARMSSSTPAAIRHTAHLRQSAPKRHQRTLRTLLGLLGEAHCILFEELPDHHQEGTPCSNP